jgi:hypothetical protein
MSENTNAPIQINFKTKKDGMLINLRANDGAELDLLIDQLSQRLAGLIDLESSFESAAQAANATNLVASQLGGTVIGTTATPRPVQQAPSNGTPDCNCGAGPMRFVPAGIAKSTGRPYKAFYACPKPQGQACQHKVTV